jgi:TM2 domain-containing membrane protein YozV
MKQVNSGTAYLLWCLCLVGICGGQRFYTGSFSTGLIYFFTLGFFGVGQLLDLVLIPVMVDRRNTYLRGIQPPSVNQSITLNLGDIPQLKQPQVTQVSSPSLGTPMQKLLRAAKENNGQLSLAQAVMYTELDHQEVKQLLQEAEKQGLAETCNDPNTGAIRYRFDL